MRRSQPSRPAVALPPAVSRTLGYYEREAEGYAAQTRDLDVALPLGRFLSHLPPGSRVLDAGCGSGRDGLTLRAMGHEVALTEPVAALAALAEAHTGIPVRRIRHEEMADRDLYDGVWAMATLLHLPRTALPEVLRRYTAALRPGGILAATFKEGRGEGADDRGRWFTYYSEPELRALVEATPGLEVVAVHTDGDALARAGTTWLQLVARRRPSSG